MRRFDTVSGSIKWSSITSKPIVNLASYNLNTDLRLNLIYCENVFQKQSLGWVEVENSMSRYAVLKQTHNKRLGNLGRIRSQYL